MVANDPVATPGQDKPELPPVPADRRLDIQCGTCGWNAWVAVPITVRALHFDREGKTGEIRGTPVQILACAGCANRLFLNRGPDGTLDPSFDMPRNPLYRDALSGRGAGLEPG